MQRLDRDTVYGSFGSIRILGKRVSIEVVQGEEKSAVRGLSLLMYRLKVEASRKDKLPQLLLIPN